MRFFVQNVGKVETADLQLNGITIVVGDNNAGKTTVSRALYAFVNSLYNIDLEVCNQRVREISRIVRNFFISYRRPIRVVDRELRSTIDAYLHDESDGGLAIRQYLMTRFGAMEDEVDIDRWMEKISNVKKLPNKSIRHQIIENYFGSVFSGQCVSLRRGVDNGLIRATVDGYPVEMCLKETEASYSSKINIQRRAYFVDSPDLLNVWGSYRSLVASPSLNGSIRKAIEEKLFAATDEPGDSAFDDLIFAEKYGQFVKEVAGISQGQFVFDETNSVLRFSEVDPETGALNNYDLNNVSEGLKSFGVIELLLRYRIFREKDILIFDEPEVHLHPEWQLKYAQIIVKLQKVFNLRVLITTHSPNFMLAIKYYSQLENTDKSVISYCVKHSQGNPRFSVIEEKKDLSDWDDAYYAFVKAAQKMQDLQSRAMGENSSMGD